MTATEKNVKAIPTATSTSRIRREVKDAVLIALQPAILESIGLIVDILKEARTEITEKRKERNELRPLFHKISMLQSIEQIETLESKAQARKEKAEQERARKEEELINAKVEAVLAARSSAEEQKEVNGYDHRLDA